MKDKRTTPAPAPLVLEEIAQKLDHFGCKAFLAHPNLQVNSREVLESVISSAEAAGITGVEKYNSATEAAELNWYAGVSSIGSSYTGRAPHDEIGNIKDNCRMEDKQKIDLIGQLFAVELRDMELPLFDMHVHSTCSDGTATPEELLYMAQSYGLSMFSITDHDSVEAYNEILKVYEEGRFPEKLIYVPGVELTTQSKVDHSCQHMCCYFPFMAIAKQWPVEMNFEGQHLVIEKPIMTEYQQCQYKLFQEKLLKARMYRSGRIVQMLRNVNENMGLSLSVEEFCRENQIDPVTYMPKSAVGRPHLARFLVRHGLSKSVNECFRTILSETGPNFINTDYDYLEDMAKRLSVFGGKCIIAHPNLEMTQISQIKKVVFSAVESGVVGIEKYHTQTSVDEVRWFRGVVSIGSDYHGQERRLPFGNLAQNKVMSLYEKEKLVRALFGVSNKDTESRSRANSISSTCFLEMLQDL